MLAIRMQRTGRKGHAQFRVIVQDAHRSPTSGKVVAGLGHYNPHTKAAVVDKEKAAFYLEHGAQPSDRVAQLLTQEGVKLPTWVKQPTKKSKEIRHSDKLRKNRPAEPKAESKPEKPDSDVSDDVKTETSSEPETAITEAAEPETKAPDEDNVDDDKASKKPADEIEESKT